MKLRIIRFNAGDETHFQTACSIRHRVFVEEQSVDPALEHDEHETVSDHYLLFDDNEPRAACRVRTMEDGAWKIERVAVLREWRGMGYGFAIMDEVERLARLRGVRRMKLHAQTRVKDFYLKCGWKLSMPDVFIEAGVPHVAMEKSME